MIEAAAAFAVLILSAALAVSVQAMNIRCWLFGHKWYVFPGAFRGDGRLRRLCIYCGKGQISRFRREVVVNGGPIWDDVK